MVRLADEAASSQQRFGDIDCGNQGSGRLKIYRSTCFAELVNSNELELFIISNLDEELCTDWGAAYARRVRPTLVSRLVTGCPPAAKSGLYNPEQSRRSMQS
jgi:hypothetical protein